MFNMKKNIISKLKIASLVAALLICFVPLSANALFEGATDQACRGASLGDSPDCDPNAAASKVDSTLQQVVNILTTIVGIIAVILIIINGLRFITANGDSNNITAARNGVIYAIIGLIVVAMAQLIVRFVINRTSS